MALTIYMDNYDECLQYHFDLSISFILLFPLRGMGLASTCILCGRTVSTEPASEQEIDGTVHIFDSNICKKTFRKFQDIYGKSFVSCLELSV